MAYGRRKKRLPYGIYKVAQSAARAARVQKATEAIDDAMTTMATGAATAKSSVELRRQMALASGMGAYSLGDKIKRMSKSWLGKGLRRAGEWAIGQTQYGDDYASLKSAMAPRGSGLYTGMGAYQSNDLIDGNLNDPIPDFGSDSPEAGIVVSRKEYVCEIYGPAALNTDPVTTPAFAYQIIPINPGLEKCFPWVSQIAANYNEFEMLQLIFTFQPTIVESNNTENGQVGQIVMATQYNTSLPPFANMQQMLQASSPSRGKITEIQYQGVECDPSANSGSFGKYVRTGPIPPSAVDPSKYDVGFLQIGLCNISPVYANVSLGQLYVSYTMRLRKPRLMTTLGNTITKDIYISAGNETAVTPFGPANADGTYTNLLMGQQNNLGCRITTAQNTTYGHNVYVVFPATFAGNLKIFYTVSSSSAPQNYSVGAQGNVALVPDLYGYTGSSETSDAPVSTIFCSTAGGATLLHHIRVDIATNGQDNIFWFGLNWAVNPSVTQVYLDISEYNASFSGKSLNINASDAPIWVNSVTKQIQQAS